MSWPACCGSLASESTLYALAADSPEELQRLIDVVDKFCRRWRMDISVKKSEVILVRKPTCES